VSLGVDELDSGDWTRVRSRWAGSAVPAGAASGPLTRCAGRLILLLAER
jgi:hypothetical protein